jgi:hypothetical protein
MTDKELLELAAKADGRKTERIAGKLWIEKCTTEWNPLTDDGDALRLSVNLDMDIVFDFDRVMVVFGDADATCITEYFYDLPKSTNRLDATRKAIVRAAAEIGKGMK